jgi:uncharacterized protein (TIGR03083 family)
MSEQRPGLDPILCAHLLRKVDEELVHLLRSLAPDEWALPTVAPAWTVRDVAAHLLDTSLRKLSIVRDGWVVDAVEIRSPAELAALVDRLNREGVTVYRRLSPPLLIDLMKAACEQSASFHESLDPFAPAAFAVSWAGEEQSLNWFDTARELTERWHHQQQIRLATGRPGITSAELYHPVLDCFLRGLPFHLRGVDAAEAAAIEVEITGDAGGRWLLSRGTGRWAFVDGLAGNATARVVIPDAIAWRLFTKGIEFESARSLVRIEGERGLGESILRLTAIVAP